MQAQPISERRVADGAQTTPAVRHNVFLAIVNNGKTKRTFPKMRIIYLEGDAADEVFYIQEGQVKRSVLSDKAKNPLSRLWNVVHIGQILSRRIDCLYSSLLNLVLHD
jgi:hypothetical protein